NGQGQELDRILAGIARGDLAAGLVRSQVGVPALAQARPGQPPLEFRRGFRGCRLIAMDALPPLADQRLALGDGAAEVLARLVRNVERAIRIPTVGLLGQPDLFDPERLAMRLLTVLAVRAAVADVGSNGDQAGSFIVPGPFDR